MSAKARETTYPLNLFYVEVTRVKTNLEFRPLKKFTVLRNMQIEILSESPRRRSKLCRPRHPRIITPLLLGTSKSPLLLVQAS